VTAAGPLRGPEKEAAAPPQSFLCPLRVRGRSSGLQGATAPPCGRRPCGPPWTPETTAAPGSRKSGQATGLPHRQAGTRRPAPLPGDHQNRSLHTSRGTPEVPAGGICY
jgi:hypothetical protein